MVPAGDLAMSIRRRGDVLVLALAGDLDLATAHLLREAMTRLRIIPERGRAIVIDTQALDFVAVAGYRALQAELVRPDGVPDPGVTCIVGPVVAKFESALGTALALSRRPRPAVAKPATGTLSPMSRRSWPRSTTRQSPRAHCVRKPSRQPKADG